jgi:hypothetical protein
MRAWAPGGKGSPKESMRGWAGGRTLSPAWLTRDGVRMQIKPIAKPQPRQRVMGHLTHHLGLKG